MSRLEPLSEEPVIDDEGKRNRLKKVGRHSWKHWLRAQFSVLYGRRSENDLKILLSVLGCPLFPVSPGPKLLIGQVIFFKYRGRVHRSQLLRDPTPELPFSKFITL